MKKKLAVLIVFIVLSSLLIPYASADDMTDYSLSSDSEDSIDYVYILSASTSLSIGGGGYASISNNITCVAAVDKIVMSTYLQQYNGSWVTVNHWTDTVYSNTASSGHGAYVASGYNYRALVYFYAYDGSSYESTTRTDTEYY